MTQNEKKQLIELAEACRETAERCAKNPLVGNTWIQQSFEGLEQRLRKLAEQG